MLMRKIFRHFQSPTQIDLAIIVSSLYVFCALVANVAATKVTYLGPWVMDAGLIYALTFTLRDLMHKQLGTRAALSMVYMSSLVNFLAAFYFQFAVWLPAESSWALAGGQSAWEFIFSLQLRIVIGSVAAGLIAGTVDTLVYSWWVRGLGKNKPQWMRVVISNAISIPVDSVIFPLIAFAGVVSSSAMIQMFYTNVIVKVVISLLISWSIYLVPEKPIYRKEK